MPYISDQMYARMLAAEERDWYIRAMRHDPTTDPILLRSLDRMNDTRELIGLPPVSAEQVEAGIILVADKMPICPPYGCGKCPAWLRCVEFMPGSPGRGEWPV